jgi:hypothetical protein
MLPDWLLPVHIGWPGVVLGWRIGLRTAPRQAVYFCRLPRLASLGVDVWYVCKHEHRWLVAHVLVLVRAKFCQGGGFSDALP